MVPRYHIPCQVWVLLAWRFSVLEHNNCIVKEREHESFKLSKQDAHWVQVPVRLQANKLLHTSLMLYQLRCDVLLGKEPANKKIQLTLHQAESWIWLMMGWILVCSSCAHIPVNEELCFRTRFAFDHERGREQEKEGTGAGERGGRSRRKRGQEQEEGEGE